ncbi:MAG: hypothetical protein AUH42_00635 [Gemmatimonadetes bacterium 13_1_40CM_70_11]|nr:MAG: hypothetical protein AUH42_00635 [Gemmatimonadetes bacterium 13_1_40CM_70_11]
MRYTLRVDSADLAGFDVELRIQSAPDTFRLAMAAHPEYDDRYWRFVEGGGPRVEARSGPATIAREDSALWRVVAPGGEAVVRYRLRLPPPPAQAFRSAWKPFLAPSGGLVGGPHSFLYVVGAELGPASVTLVLPAGWEIATGLEPTADPRTFFAPSADVLVDSPILVGHLRAWRFAVDGVPHRVVYWPLPGAAPFDTAAFVDGVQRIVRQAVALFSRAPYREYTFLFQDGAYGALEHRNSVTLGAPSADLARSPAALLAETAHEYFHTWNLMRIRPAEYRDVDWRPQPAVAGLWFSEGLTMFYADLLLRRAGLPVFDSTRTAHLERLIASYLANPGNVRFSAEAVSRVAYGSHPDALGDYSFASTHLQGELLGVMLDIVVRDATNGARSMDDVMRLMLERFSDKRGFVGSDVEQTVGDVCRCRVKALFDAHVRAASPIDFDRYLRLIGLRARVTWSPALGRDGRPAADLRLWAWLPAGEGGLRLLLSDPASVWGRAGLHTGDQVAVVNGAPLTTMADFRALLGRLRVGDTVRIEVTRPTGPWRASVVVAGYDRPSVRIEEIPEATERQRALRARWLAASP